MVWNVWDGSRGSGVGEESLGLLWGDMGGYTGPKNSVWVKDEYGVPDMSLKGFGLVWRVCGGCKGV